MKESEPVPLFDGEEIVFVAMMCAGIVVIAAAAVIAWLM